VRRLAQQIIAEVTALLPSNLIVIREVAKRREKETKAEKSNKRRAYEILVL
jgi:hypothetical protein